VSSTRTVSRRTLWEEGRHPGRLVRTLTATVLLAVALVDTMVFGRLTLLFDIVFVGTCVAAALAVRPRDFFIVGVLPPLSMLVIVAILAALNRVAVAEPGDGLVQATVSGLAHRAGALVVGYTLTLAILALRQVAYRNAGTIRSGARRSGAVSRSRSASRAEASGSSRHVAPAPAAHPTMVSPARSTTTSGAPPSDSRPAGSSPMPVQRPAQERIRNAR
jgi:hypothetical protein